MSFFKELNRRNVFRVGTAYLVAAWLLLQVVDLVLDAVPAPGWVMQIFLLATAVGFPIVLLFAWAYEITPEGLKSEKDVDRDQSITSQTGRRLNRLTIVVLIVAVAVLLTDKFVLQQEPASEMAGSEIERSVAVLPFVAMSNGPDDEYFADGITEEILNSLSQLPELLVTARTSAFALKGQDVSIPEIAARLGVAHVVEGSVRRAGEQLRITAQLIRADDGFHLWSDTYDRSNKDSLGVQAEIAEKVASALEIVLDEEQLARMRSVGLRNPEAFIAFQRGSELYDLSHGSEGQLELLVEANTWFDKAIALAPEFYNAYLLHSDQYAHLLIEAANGRAIPEEELKAAISHMERDFEQAMRFAPDEPRRLAASFDLALLSGRWRGLTAMFDEIVKQQSCWLPNWLNLSTVPFGRAREFLITQQKLLSCDPLSYSGWWSAAQSNIWLGEHKEAIEVASRGLEATSHIRLRQQLILAHVGAGQFDQAEIAIDRGALSERFASTMRVAVAAASGDAAKTKALINDFVAAGFEDNEEVIVMRARAGERDLANKLAAEIDARPFGFLLLINVPMVCVCGAPFELEETPNFARLIEDASLPWPPASPIEWPLKDW
jgi:TolB-like protein